MIISRWKVMACLLCVSVGGLAVFAGEPNDRLQSAAPAPDCKCCKPGPDGKPGKCACAPQQQVARPVLVAPVAQPVPCPPVAVTPAPAIVTPPYALQPPPPLPMPAIVVPPDVVVTPPVAVPDAPAVAEPAPMMVEQLPMPREEATGSAAPATRLNERNFDVKVNVQEQRTGSTLPGAGVNSDAGLSGSVVPTPVPPKPQPAAPMSQELPPPPPVPMPSQPAQQFKTASAEAPAMPVVPLKMSLRVGHGSPKFDIRNGDELLLTVHCDKIEMPAPPEGTTNGSAYPLTGVTASGKVRFRGPGVEGTCDHLSFLSASGEVLLKGNIHMKSKKGKSATEVTAEKMIFQLGGSSASVHGPGSVTPASYSPPPSR